MTALNLPDWPWQTVRGLAADHGVRVWLVGGAVRDLLLDRVVHDWDFAVDRGALGLGRAVGDAVGGAFFPLDAERGTARVVIERGEGARIDLDFALLRGSDLEDDLDARDFTINAMALNEVDGLIDPLGGRGDLEAGVVRATGSESFRDDPVRLLRAPRFEAELGFETEPETEAWIKRDAPLLGGPAAERRRDEFVRGLGVPGAAGFVQRLDELHLLDHVVPDLLELKGVSQCHPHRLDVWRHTLTVVEAVEAVGAVASGQPLSARSEALLAVPGPAWGELARWIGQFQTAIRDHLAVTVCDRRDRALLLKLAAVLHDVGKAETWSVDDEERIHFYGHESVGARKAASRLRALRFCRGEVAMVRRIVLAHLRPAHLARGDRVSRRAIYRYFRDTGDVGADTVLLSLADHLATWGPNLRPARWRRRLEVAEMLLYHYFERPEHSVNPALPVDGHDLMQALELEPGPEVGRLLELLREAVAAGEIETREQALGLAERLMDGEREA